jgi:hypothetical protein
VGLLVPLLAYQVVWLVHVCSHSLDKRIPCLQHHHPHY